MFQENLWKPRGDFFDSGKFGNTAKKYQCFSPQIALHCDFLENLSDKNLLLGGDISKVEYDLETNTFGKNAGIFEDNLLLTKQFIGNYSVPYFNVAHLTGKNIVKNVLLLTPEIYYLSIYIRMYIYIILLLYCSDLCWWLYLWFWL